MEVNSTNLLFVASLFRVSFIIQNILNFSSFRVSCHFAFLPRPQFSSVQSLSHVLLLVTPWTVARQAYLSITNSQNSPKLMSIESVMPSKVAVKKANVSSRKEGRKIPVPMEPALNFQSPLHKLHANINTILK